MIIIHGVYRWTLYRTAFRNDFCLSCGGPRCAVQMRTLDVFHVFWIPLLPVGFWKRWYCMSCGEQPHVSPKTRYGFKVAGLFLLVLFSVVFWLVPIEPEAKVAIWVLRIVAPLAAVATAIHLANTRPDQTYSQRFRTVEPSSETNCPYCRVLLLPQPDCSCPRCGIKRC